MISTKMQQINENLTSNPNKSLEPMRVEVEWYSYAMNFSIVLPFLPFQSTFAKSYYEKSLPRWLSVVVHYYVEKLVPPTLCCVWRFSDGLKQNFPAFFCTSRILCSLQTRITTKYFYMAMAWWPMVSKYTVLRKFFKAVLPNWCCVNLLHRSLALLINNKTTSSVLHNTAKSATFLLSKWLSHMQKTSLSMLACGEIIIYARQIGAEHCFQRLMWPQTIW